MLHRLNIFKTLGILAFFCCLLSMNTMLHNYRSIEDHTYHKIVCDVLSECNESDNSLCLLHLWGINCENAPIAHIPKSELGNSPIRLGKALSAHRRFLFLAKRLPLALVDPCIKSVTHIPNCLPAVDYYVFMLRRIIIWTVRFASEPTYFSRRGTWLQHYRFMWWYSYS